MRYKVAKYNDDEDDVDGDPEDVDVGKSPNRWEGAS